MKILVADDDPINRRLLEAFLVKLDYEVLLARDGGEAWNILQQQDSPRLAILDWMMPGKDGIEICRELRKVSEADYVYVLLLTAKFQKSDLIIALDAGADDYLTKPFDIGELKARLRTGRRILKLQEQLSASYEKLKFEISHDPLTGLASRSCILETLGIELERARRQGTSMGILMTDLDYFKHANDTYGHLAGDAVLREAAKRMLSSVRPYDSIGRYGGEEFLIVLPESDISGAMSQAERLRAAIGTTPFETSEALIPVTMSLGVTIGGGKKASDVEWLLQAADMALYQAKHGGRNQVEVCRDDLERVGSAPHKSPADKALVEG